MKGMNRGGSELAKWNAKKARVLSLELTRALRAFHGFPVVLMDGKEVAP